MHVLRVPILAAAFSLCLAAAASAQSSSISGWPALPVAPVNAPNVLLILVDDAGYSVTSTFGGAAATPNFSKLAASGLRFNQFHVNAVCSPTRAALLSGRNSHMVGFGSGDASAPYPGYNLIWPKNAASIAEVLKENGYSTAAFGKWHNTPTWQISPVGPFDRWPTGLGFEYFYGFMGGDDNQYYPRIYQNTTPVEPSTTPAEGYHFTSDMTSHAIQWLHQHDAIASNKPFFIYFATGATHAPIQVPKKWIEMYKGKFDQGWDKMREETFARQKQLGIIPANTELTPRPEGLPAWDSLTPDEKKLVSHQAEAYAGFATQTDYQLGLLLDAIREEGKADNTIVIEIFGDNGGSAQGGIFGSDAYDIAHHPESIRQRLATSDDYGSETFMNHYPAAWAWAFSTPFQGTKVDASHLGGVTDPMILSWPGHIKDAGGLRSQFSYITDIAPTIYDLTGIAPPKSVNGVVQQPLEGISLTYTFDHPNAPTRHNTQIFEFSGNRAIYKDGWWAGNLYHNTWETTTWTGDLNHRPWELYNLNDDFSQAHDLAATHPEKLKEMQQLFDEVAKKEQVYPLLPKMTGYPLAPGVGQNIFVYRSGVDRLPLPVAGGVLSHPVKAQMDFDARAAERPYDQHAAPPMLSSHSYTITAKVTIPVNAHGVIFAEGGRYGGATLFVKNNRVYYEFNASAHLSGRLVSAPLKPGRNEIVVHMDQQPPNGDVVPGKGTLTINGKIESTANFINLNAAANETIDIGSDLGSAVSTEYQSPYRFTGAIDTVTIRLE